MIRDDAKDKELNMGNNTSFYMIRDDTSFCFAGKIKIQVIHHQDSECTCMRISLIHLQRSHLQYFLPDLRKRKNRIDDFQVRGSRSFPLKSFWQHQQFPFYVPKKLAESSINSTIKQSTIQVRDAKKETWHTQLASLSKQLED